MKPAAFLLFQLKGETQATAINPTLADLKESPYSLLSRISIQHNPVCAIVAAAQQLCISIAQ
jgi:hypothetical protein